MSDCPRHFRVLLPLVLSGIVLAVGVAAVLPGIPAVWAPAVDLSQALGRCRQITLARDPLRGDVHVVWTERRGSRWAIWHRYWRAADGAWELPANLTGFRQDERGPVLAFDLSGNGHLLWTRRRLESQGAEADSTEIIHRTWDGQSWFSEQIISHLDSYLAVPYNLVLVEADGIMNLFVSYGGGFAQAQLQNGSWSPLGEWNWTLGIGIAAAVADAMGNIHVAGYGPNSGTGAWDEYFSDAYYAVFDGSAWSTAINLSSTDGAAYDIDLAFDSSGRLHFIWSDQGSPYSSESTRSAIYERVLEGGAWSSNSEIIQYNPDQGVQDLELDVDDSATLHLAWAEGVLVDYVDTDIQIYYQGFDGTNWLEEQQVHMGPIGSWNLSMDASGGDVFLAWEEWPFGAEAVYFSSTRGDMGQTQVYHTWLPKITIP
jgi:hypothetical protein